MAFATGTVPKHDSRASKLREINGNGEETGNGMMVKTSPADIA
jgi:hypothetical protein